MRKICDFWAAEGAEKNSTLINADEHRYFIRKPGREKASE